MTDDVLERIRKQVESNPVILYMKGTPEFPMCGYSARAAQALQQCGVEFAYVNVLMDPEIFENLPRFANWPTFPQLYIEGELVGGLYGVAIGGLFAGESMFHHARDASKVALVHLVVIMNEGGGALLDVQWQTHHLESLGAIVIGREAYLERLAEALRVSGPFSSSPGEESG